MAAVGAGADRVAVHRPDEPASAVLALASIEYDISKVALGQQVGASTGAAIRCSCAAARRRRSPRREAVHVADLLDPLARNANLPDDAPATDANRAAQVRSG